MDNQQRLLVSAHFEATQAINQIKLMSKAIREQQNALRGTGAAAAEYAAAQGRAGQGLRNVRGIAQQAGYQIADLAIVLQQGQDGFKAMAIQGGQFVGALGPLGAALGGVVTVGGLVLSVFKDMREQGAEIPAVMAAILDGFKAVGDYIKVAAIPNFKLFISDMVELAKTSKAFQIVLGGLVFLIWAKLIPAFQALFQLIIRNPFTLLIAAAVAGAVYIISEWDKVKVFFDLALPAAIDSAKAGWYSFQEAALTVVRNVTEYLANLVEGPINAVNEGLTELYNLFADNPIPFEPIQVGATAIAALDGMISDAADNANRYSEAAREGFQAWRDALDEINRKRKEGLEVTQEEIDSANEAGAAAKAAAEETRKWQDELGQMGTLIEHGLTSGVDGFVDALFDAEKSFKEFARTFLIEIGKMIAKQIILNALSQALTGGIPTGGASADTILNSIAGIANAKGNAFDNGQVTAFANGGVVSRPTVFPMRNGGVGLMGEAGPEAVMPLSRGSDGRLGVSGPAITINNYSGASVAVTRSDDEVIEIAVNRATENVQATFSRDMQTGQGAYARSLEQGYTTRRRAT